MITKRTDELRPGDRVQTPYGTRAVLSLSPRTHQRIAVLLEVPASDTPDRVTVHKTDEWKVDDPEPSPLVRAAKLELAVQRAQELADKYKQGVRVAEGALGDFRELLDLFRAAR